MIRQLKDVYSGRDFIKLWQEVSYGDYRGLRDLFYNPFSKKMKRKCVALLQEGDVIQLNSLGGFPGWVSDFNNYHGKLAVITALYKIPVANIRFLDDCEFISDKGYLVPLGACVPLKAVVYARSGAPRLRHRIKSKGGVPWLKKWIKKIARL